MPKEYYVCFLMVSNYIPNRIYFTFLMYVYKWSIVLKLTVYSVIYIYGSNLSRVFFDFHSHKNKTLTY